MGWKDTLKEGAKELMGSDLGQDLARRAREKAEQSIDKILGGQPDEGGRLAEESQKDAKASAEVASENDDGSNPRQGDDGNPSPGDRQ
jgi:hypothetical protein